LERTLFVFSESNGPQIDRHAAEKPGTDEKMNLQICGAGRKSPKWFMLVVKKKPYGKSRLNSVPND
jgi:hypothetical protein